MTQQWPSQWMTGLTVQTDYQEYAAPDLLGTVEQVATWLREWGNVIQIGTNEEVDPWPLLDELESVLAKARGQ